MSAITEAYDRIERATALDRPAGAARDAVHRVLADHRLKDVLHGVWLGHPLHPGLAQLALGSLTSASLIDAAGGSERESNRLITIGLLASAPTAAAGWADYSDGHEEQQRVGLVHAVVNVVALACYTGSVLSSGRRGRRRALSVAGGLLAGLAAALGGHLSFHLASGANHGEEVQHIGPDDWQPVGPVLDIPLDTPVQRTIGGLPALVVRHEDGPRGSGTGVSVLSDRCTHLSAPLHDGQLEITDGLACITCPWHGSVFRVHDGSVVHGPATAPAPIFDTRVLDGVLEARARTLPGVSAS